jgi:hypothetical protein
MKGQYFSFDAIIASVIFVLALVALLSYWHSVRSFLDYQNDQLSKDAVSISNLLFTPPSPSSDCVTMDRLGFAMGWDDRRVDSDVLECALAQDEAWLKVVTGTAFGIQLKVTNIAEEDEHIVGDAPGSGARDVVNIRRLATVYNQTDGKTYPASFDLTLYR